MQKLTQTNEIFNNTWQIKKCIGKGSFSEIFVARDITKEGNHLVAIKVQMQGFDSSVIRWEGDVLKALANVPTVPKFIYYGVQDRRDYLVMELLGGEDMSGLRNRIRQNHSSGLIALPAASYLARQMLTSIQQMHEHGFVHRDIKPANFVRKSKSGSEFYTIDFGIAKLHRDREGRIKPKRERAEFRGTTLYASAYTHQGHDQSPRDDLFSIMYVFLDLVCGKLPWTDATRAKDKPVVASLKRTYLDRCDRLVQWVNATATLAESNVLLKSDESDNDTYQGNFPPLAQEQCLTIFNHLKGLQYEDTPDYALINNCLLNVIENPQDHNVADPAYSYRGFHWGGGTDRFADSRGIESAAATAALAAAAARKRASGGSSTMPPPLPPLSIAPVPNNVSSSSRGATPVSFIGVSPKDYYNPNHTLHQYQQHMQHPQSQQQQQQEHRGDVSPATPIAPPPPPLVASTSTGSVGSSGSKRVVNPLYEVKKAVEPVQAHRVQQICAKMEQMISDHEARLLAASAGATGSSAADGQTSTDGVEAIADGQVKGVVDSPTAVRDFTLMELAQAVLAEDDDALRRFASYCRENINTATTSSSSSSSSFTQPSAVAVAVEKGPLIGKVGDERVVDLAVASRWRNLTRDLMLLSEEAINLNVCELFHRGLLVHDGFFAVRIPEDNKAMWATFTEIQTVAANFYALYGRIKAAAEAAGAQSNINNNNSSKDTDGEAALKRARIA